MFEKLCVVPLKTKRPRPLGDELVTVPLVLLKFPVRLTIAVMLPVTSTLPVSSVPAAIEKLVRLIVLSVAVAFNRTVPAVAVSVLIVKSRPIKFTPVPMWLYSTVRLLPFTVPAPESVVVLVLEELNNSFELATVPVSVPVTTTFPVVLPSILAVNPFKSSVAFELIVIVATLIPVVPVTLRELRS